MGPDRRTANTQVARENRRRFCFKAAKLTLAVFLQRQFIGFCKERPRVFVSGRMRTDCWELLDFSKIAEMPRRCFLPDPRRREEVIRFLANRPTLTHEEWHRRFATDRGIPLDFVTLFRNCCSKHFEYDLSAALPWDTLVEDLGMCVATWGDVEWEIWEDCEARYGGRLRTDKQPRSTTLGEFLDELWSNAQKTSG